MSLVTNWKKVDFLFVLKTIRTITEKTVVQRHCYLRKNGIIYFGADLENKGPQSHLKSLVPDVSQFRKFHILET